MARSKQQSKKDSKKQSLIITTSGKRSIHEVARDLKDAGLDVDQVLDQINVVTGSAHPDAKRRLREISGVADVSEDNPVDIGPPGAPVS